MPPIFIILFVVVVAVPVALALGFSIGHRGRFGLAGWLLSAALGSAVGWWIFGPGFDTFTYWTLWDIPILPGVFLAMLFVLAWLNIPGRK